VWVVAFSPDGTQVATAAGRYDPGVSTDNAIRLWNIASGTEVVRFPQPTVAQRIRFSSDGRRLLSVDNWGVRVWDVASGSELFVLGATDAPSTHTVSLGAPSSVSFDMRTILVREEDSFGVVDYASGKERCTITPITKGNSVAELSPDGNRIATAPNGIIVRGTVQIWDTGTCQQVQSFAASTSVSERPSFSADGRSIIANIVDPPSAQLWDVQTGLAIRRFAPPGGHEVWNVLLSPDGKRLLMKWNFLQQRTPVNETSL
jgi:WD40 repeat protein